MAPLYDKSTKTDLITMADQRGHAEFLTKVQCYPLWAPTQEVGGSIPRSANPKEVR